MELNQTLEEQLANARSLLKVAGKRIAALENEVETLEKTIENIPPTRGILEVSDSYDGVSKKGLDFPKGVESFFFYFDGGRTQVTINGITLYSGVLSNDMSVSGDKQ